MTQDEAEYTEPQYEFTAAQRERVRAALVTKFSPGFPPCVMCRATRWRIAKSLLTVPSAGVDPSGLLTAPGFYIFIGIICQTCGNTVFLDTDKLGLSDLVGGGPAEGDTPGEDLGP